MPELLQVADRILVMRQGRITGELPGRTTQEEIMRYAALERGGPFGMMQRLLPFLSLIVLFVALAIASPHFLTNTNLSSVVRQTAVINIMALGMTMIIITGGIDLSVGAILAMGGLLGTMAHGKRRIRFRRALLIGMLTGLLWGLCNGLLITRLRIAPFIVTLGTLGIFRGTDADHLERPAGAPDPAAASRSWAKATAGRAVRALDPGGVRGGDARHPGAHAAGPLRVRDRQQSGRRRSTPGVPVTFHTTAVYAIGGMLTGLAGMIEASRLMTGQPTAGKGYELQAIAAVVIGGGSLHGGEGSVVGTLIGAFIMGLLSNGSDLLGVSPYLQQAIIGAVIILAVTVDELRKRRLA